MSSIYLHICGYLTCNAVLVILFNYFVIPTIISLSNSLIILKYNSQFSNIFVGYLIFNILWSNIMVFMISVIWNLLKFFLWLIMSPIIIYFWYMHERNFYLGAGLPGLCICCIKFVNRVIRVSTLNLFSWYISFQKSSIKYYCSLCLSTFLGNFMSSTLYILRLCCECKNP